VTIDKERGEIADGGTLAVGETPELLRRRASQPKPGDLVGQPFRGDTPESLEEFD
jgi:hypothetical protein